ncbi:MAG TPA: hypothetical protein VH138_15130 [Vicinamibacterales bacterium]|jgi:hypothetical protein|nr:hypothetical protein [Vicinamibacterales bacterium]
MKRTAFLSVVLLSCLSFIPAAFAQTKTAAKKDATSTTTTTAPVSPELMKARMKSPLKGTAAIEFIAVKPKVANGEVQGVIRVKNVDNAPIVGLVVDEYFYAKGAEVSACTARVRSPIAAGEIVDVPISCPNPKETVDNNNLVFRHANGKVQPKPVKKFTGEDDKKTVPAPTKKK